MKKLFDLLLALSFVASGFNSIGVLANEEVKATEFVVEHDHGCIDCEEATITPLAQACTCGGSVVYEKSYTSWEEEKRACSHGYLFGVDYYQVRVVTTVPKCQKCGLQLGAATTSRQTRYVSCAGFN